VEAAGQDVGDGLGEDLGPVEIEELADARGHEADVASYVDPAHVQRIHRGDFEEESVAHLGDASGALLLEELASMLRILEALMLSPAPLVPRGDDVAVEKADLDVARDKRERLPRARIPRRHGVRIRPEPHEGGRVDACRHDEVGLRQDGRQREQPLLLFGEDVGDGAVPEARMRARVGDVANEVDELAVAVLDARDPPCREEPIAKVANGPFDASFVGRSPRPAQARLDAQRPCDLEKARMIPDRIAVPLEHDGLRVVEEPLSRHAFEPPRGTDERAPQRLDRQVEDELGPHRARVREHDDEDPERARSAGDGQLADMGPVHLRLLADETLRPQVDLPAWDRPHVGDVTPEDRDPALEAAHPDHVEEARRAKTRVHGECLVDEVDVGIDEARPRRDEDGRRGGGVEDAVNDIGVHAERGADRPAFPLLGVVKTADVVLLLEIDGHEPTPSRQS
jgi:hypothetical protein